MPVLPAHLGRRARVAGLFVSLALFAACGGGSPGDAPGAPPPPQLPAEPWDLSSLPALDKLLPPSGNFDLSHWKLTLPSALEIQAPLMPGFQLVNTFYTDPGSGGMVFRCPNHAQTTANSNYSRTELREMRAPYGPASSPANNWLMEEGGTLRAALRIDHVSLTGTDYKQGRLIIGQIHAIDTEVIRLLYQKKPNEATGRIYAGMDSADGSNDIYTDDIVSNAGDAGIPLGEIFSYEIKLAQGLLVVTIDRASGERVTFARSIDPGYAGRRMYFKAGVYNQNNTGDADEYAQATFFALNASHP